MVAKSSLDTQLILDGLGQGIMIFDAANRLLMENRAARSFLGQDLKLVRQEGWRAACMLFDTRLTDPDNTIDAIRARALESDRPVRFHTYRAGERVPCWAAAVQGQNGDVYTMIVVDVPDWSALTELMSKYLEEVNNAVDSTRGHADLIAKSAKASTSVEMVSKRISGFTKLIDTHMHRLHVFTGMIERLEEVRTGRLRERLRQQQHRFDLANYVEDFLEELDAHALIDPESDSGDVRKRIKVNVPDGLVIDVSPWHLRAILRDILRNAIMYSLKATPVFLSARASPSDQTVQIDVADEGYGIRDSEREKVFLPFVRSRQPQIIGEFGYGLSLYLCKHEIEAMNGRIWFKSEEGVGSTFSFKLPLWRPDADGNSDR